MTTISKPGRPRNDLLAEQRREEILAVATTAFAQNGYPGTDVQMIADQLGIGKGTIYRYFATKEELFLASVDRGMQRLSAAIRRDTDNVGDPLEKVVLAVRSYLRFFDNEPQMLELIIQERAEFRDRKKPTYLQHREKNVGEWHELLRMLVAADRIRPIEVERVTETLSTLLYGTIFLGHFHKNESFESRASNILKIVLGGLLTSKELPNLSHYLGLQVPQCK